MATAIRALALDFDRLIRERDVAALASRLARAEASGETEFWEFAAGLRRDLAAVKAPLGHEWSNTGFRVADGQPLGEPPMRARDRRAANSAKRRARRSRIAFASGSSYTDIGYAHSG